MGVDSPLIFLQDYGCRASVDSLLKSVDYGPSLRSRGQLLQSVATAQSTMDYSTMAVDEGVVESPVTRALIPESLNSPSPVWPLSFPRSPPLERPRSTPTKRSLYEGKGDDHYDVKLEVWFYIHLKNVFCSFSSFVGLRRIEL